jgi:GDP-4-dehydro-6-deoxy-D-mannose reductase
MKRVAVFGIAGFSGRHFERFVAREGLASEFEFFGFGRDLSRAEHTGSFVYREGDACHESDVLNFIEDVGPAYVLNLTGIFKAERLEGFLAVHVVGVRTICDAVRRHSGEIEKLVFVGSAAEYGSGAANPVKEEAEAQPINEYGLSKLYQTELCGYFYRNHGLPTVVARTFNIVGEGLSPQLSIGHFMKQIAALPDGGTIRVGNIATSRDFLNIAEVSRRYWKLLMKGVPGEIYNVCSGVPRTIRSVLEELIRESGKHLSIETDPLLLRQRDVETIYGDSTKYDRLSR